MHPEPAPTTRARDLAQSLDCMTEEDLCDLCNITPGTAEAWRKRRKGPAYSLAGNRVLYPRSSVAEFVESQLREREGVSAKAQL